MALINKKHVTERDTVSYRLDRVTIELVKIYAEFIGSPQEHVVNESLLFVFRKDKEFAEWLKAQGKPNLLPSARQHEDSIQGSGRASGPQATVAPIAVGGKS